MPKTKPLHSDELHPFSTVKGLLPNHDDLVGYPKGIRATRNPKDTVELSPLVELERGYRNEILLEIKKSQIAKQMKKKGITINEKDIQCELSEENTSDSNISQDGIPDADLKFVVEGTLAAQIEKRR